MRVLKLLCVRYVHDTRLDVHLSVEDTTDRGSSTISMWRQLCLHQRLSYGLREREKQSS